MPTPLRTLGGLSLEVRDGTTAGRSTQRKRLALLALLAASRNGGVSRDKIVAYLWPESGEEQGRHGLSQALYALRRELGEDCIIAGIDELRLNAEVVPSDVAQLNAAIAAGDLEKIVAVYGGPFLDGFFLTGAPGFEEWAAQRRAEYERVYTSALDQLAAREIAAGDAQRAVARLQSRAAIDPLNSEVALRLMQALTAAGDRAGALRHYRTHSALLREEMELEPSPELAAFAEECARSQAPIRTAREPGIAGASAPVPARAPAHGRSRWIGAAAVAAAAVIFVIIIATRAGKPVTESHVLLAAVGGPDSALSMAVREALRAELEQSEGVRVLGDAVTAHTLELMRLPPNTPVNERLALEIAQRRGIPFVVTASVQAVGTGVQIVARMMDVSRERVVATLAERPNREDDVLGAVGSIAARMRERVTRIPAAEPAPLPAVTTASLPALRNYALARHALAFWERERALELLEGALVHDSLFALAHYLAGDLLWYIDKQRHSDEHMQRAFDLADRLSPREKLIVSARYQQLVRDEPDSALVYWKLLVNSYPDEPLAYEGLRWAYRALGRTADMAAASERGARFDGAQRRNYWWDRATERMEAGDSTGVFAAALRQFPEKRDAPLARTLMLWQMSRGVKPSPALRPDLAASDLQYVDLLYHDFAAARAQLDSLQHASLQFYPRAMLAQARMEWEFKRAPAAADLLLQAISWIEAADLSPPAYARLSERAAELAAHVGDEQAIERLRAVIERQDRGRNLRSYRMAAATIDAAAAFARGDYAAALEASGRHPLDMFYARSVATVLLLRGDALARAGRLNEARRIYQQLARQQGFVDGDLETRALIAHIAETRLASHVTARR